MKRIFFIALCLSAGVNAQTYYGNGYTIIEGVNADTLPDDLDARVFKSISARTVEDGLHQLLEGSGWALAGYVSADPDIYRLYRQPYADNKRSISPMPLSAALQWIAGDGWDLVVDRVNRLVSFEVRGRYARKPVAVQPSITTTAVTTTTATVSEPLTLQQRRLASPLNPYVPANSSADAVVSDVYSPENEAQSRRITAQLEAAYRQPVQQSASVATAPAKAVSTPATAIQPLPSEAPVAAPAAASTAAATGGLPSVPVNTGEVESASENGEGYNFANFIDNTSKNPGKRTGKPTNRVKNGGKT